jgi:hypothetical protein
MSFLRGSFLRMQMKLPTLPPNKVLWRTDCAGRPLLCNALAGALWTCPLRPRPSGAIESRQPEQT